MRQRYAVGLIILMLGAGVLLGASPAAAGCHCLGPIRNTGTLTGHGSTCAAAQSNLESLLQSTASQNCMYIYGDNSDACNYSETLNSCQPCSPGEMMTGSAQYQCWVCI
jgi:hypothetical protein